VASIALAVIPFGVAFGIASVQAGLEVWQAAGFSLLVFAGSAQLAAVEVIGDGGTATAAIAAGLLLNLRSVAFGVAMAPTLTGPWWKRAIWSQVMIDETTAVGSAQSDPRWRRYGYLVSGAVLFIVWNVSTLVGAAGLSSAGDLVSDWGIDATIPAAFLALLWPRLADDPQRRSALVGAAIAVALVPVAPPGVPILAAGLGVLAGWRGTARPAPDPPPPSASPPTRGAAGDDRDDRDDRPGGNGHREPPGGGDGGGGGGASPAPPARRQDR
jgi:predicted branched-subunit amino acid permease